MGERIRVKAYELYEKRGKRDGYALDDWLQAKAELTERKSLRAAVSRPARKLRHKPEVKKTH
jgi:hypothetical protein